MKEGVALLDFDGYVCKAYFAMKANGVDDYDEMTTLIDELVKSAQSKVPNCQYTIAYMSGHTYKKDIYPSYKATRKKDKGLSLFREYCKIYYSDLVLIDPLLEADDTLVLAYEHFSQGSYVVCFSDDKDLKYYCKNYCKINFEQQVLEQDPVEMCKNRIAQFVAGDREDNIKGIVGLGAKKAFKELEQLGGVTIENAISLYKNKGIDIDECMKNFILISPLNKDVIKDYDYDNETSENILGHFRYWNNKIKEVYNEEI